MTMQKLILSFSVVIFISSCSINSLVIRQMTPILQNSAQAVYEESDLDLAEKALAANLKLIDGLLKSDPDNEELLLMAAQGYAGYALGFLEDVQPARAKVLYLRARDYALRILHADKRFITAENSGLAKFEEHLQSCIKDKAAALFWTGFAWSGFINLSVDDAAAVADLPLVQVIMKRVEELDPGYYYGSVYIFWGSLYGMKPKMMGGDPHKAGEYFNKNFELNKTRFLLAYVYAARFHAAALLDEELFDTYIKQVLETPADIYPEVRLLNEIAKVKAEYLKKKKDDLF